MNNLKELLKSKSTDDMVYQVWQSTDSCGEFYSWDDCQQEEYETTAKSRRIIIVISEDV